MKAEHRKELQTNVLADRVGRMIQGIKSRPSPMAITIGVFVALGVLLVVGWWLYKQYAKEKRSSAWVAIYDATSVDDLDSIANESKGGVPGRVVRFDIARAKLRRGLERYCSRDDRDDALKNLSEAADLYASLADESKDTPILVQEALLGVGTARESLNELDGAREAYQKLVDRYKDSVSGKTAAERLKMLDDPDRQAAKLYDRIDELAGKKN
jgi:tetratricopeptide (TPR) repeat protein